MNRRLYNLAPFIRPICLTLATSSDSMVRKIKPWLSKNESRFYRDKQAKPTKRRQVLINRVTGNLSYLRPGQVLAQSHAAHVVNQGKTAARHSQLGHTSSSTVTEAR